MSLVITAAHTPTVREEPSLWVDLVTAFFRNSRSMLVGFCTFVILLTGLLAVFHRKYESRITFMVRSEGAAFPVPSFGDHPETQLAQTDTQIGTEIELLSGMDLHRQVLQALHPGLSDQALDRELLRFNRHLKVAPIPKTNLISVTYSANSQNEANATVVTLSRLYLAYRSRIRGSDGAYAFFDQQAKRYYDQLQQHQAALAQFNQQNQVALLGEEKDVTVHKLSDTRQALYENVASIREGENKIKAMASTRGALSARVTTQQRDIPNQEATQRLSSLLVDLQNKRVELLTKFHGTDRHVQEVDAQIANTEGALARVQASKSTETQSELNPLRQSVEADLAQQRFRVSGLYARQPTLVQQVNDYEAKLQSLNQATATSDDLTTNIKDDEANYDLYSKRREQARIDRTLDNDKIANVRQVSEPAILPQSRLQMMVSVGCLYGLGTLLIGGCGVLSGLWSPRIHSPRELEAAIAVPVVATIPMARASTGKATTPSPFVLEPYDEMQSSLFDQSLIESRPRTLISKPRKTDNRHNDRSNGAYLPLVEKLQRVGGWEPSFGSVFVFTACTPGQGVSHFVRGLGSELATYTGKKVAIVKPPDTYGPSFVANSHSAHQLQGRATGGEDYIKQWLLKLRVSNDFVLLDCPSLSTSYTATALSTHSEGVVVVAGAGTTTRTQLRGGFAKLSLAESPIIGVALNKRRYPIPNAIYTLL